MKPLEVKIQAMEGESIPEFAERLVAIKGYVTNQTVKGAYDGVEIEVISSAQDKGYLARRFETVLNIVGKRVSQ